MLEAHRESSEALPSREMSADSQRDQTPYCSDACRNADQGASSSSTSAPFTSPLPAGMYSSPPRPKERRESAGGSPTKSPLIRPALRALPTVVGVVSAPAPGNDSSGFDKPVITITSGTKRDRRAFSFPDPPASESLTFARRHARQSTVMSPANKRSIMASLTPISQPDDKKLLRLKERKSAVSTGVNTPFGNDSVFCSTSDSSDDGIEHIEYKAASASAALTVPLLRQATLPPVAQPSTLPKFASEQFSTLRSQLSSGRTNSLHSREASHSPVAAIVASSASSRSREDIMSWARGVRSRPGTEEEDDEDRGRPRTRRLTSISSRPNEPLQESDEEGVEEDVSGSGLGTTPKGRIGSALSGLGMTYGVGSIVKALTADTTSPGKAQRSEARSVPAESPAGALTALPSAASVSRVAVFAHTNPSLPLEEATSQLHLGTTPTLSTMSLSELPDFSVQDTHDPAEIFTDDGGMSATSSNFVRRVSMAGKLPSRSYPQQSSLSNSVVQTPSVERPERHALPRPLVSTASALWTMTSYFTRFAPFSISSVMPFSAGDTPEPSTPAKSGIATPAKILPAAMEITQPRSQPDSPMNDAQELVRSLPMAIIPPPCSTDEDWERNRQRAQEQAQMAQQRSSRSRARSKSRRRDSHHRDRTRDEVSGHHGRRERRRSPSRDSSPSEWTFQRPVVSREPAIGSTNQAPDSDADVSGDEAQEESRGRRGRGMSVRGKHIGAKPYGNTALLGAEADAGAVSTGTETERGRGRSRSVRPSVRA